MKALDYNIKKIFITILFLIFSSKMAMAASGTCGSNLSSASLILSNSFQQVSANAPIGSIIGTPFTTNNGVVASAGGKATLTPSSTNKPPYYATWTVSKALVSGMSYNGAPVYQTGFTGIGVAIWGDSYTSGPKVLLSNSTVAGTYSKPINFAFIKTAATTATGDLVILPFSTMALQCTNASGATITSPSESATAQGINVKFAVTACGVDNTTINVPLGDVKRSAFTGVGSTSPEKSFVIVLTCTATTKVKLTLAPGGSGAFNATSGVINLDKPTSGTQATGVGIQLLYKSAIAPLNKAISVGSVTTANSIFTVALGARYYQTASPVTAGAANGTATFTMTYN